MKSSKLLWILAITILLVPFVHATITSITPSSPANNTITTDTTPDFTFTAISDINATFSCSSIVDAATTATNATTSNNTATTLTSSTLSEGTRNWRIDCTDVNGTASSLSYDITIDATNPTSAINAPADGTNTTDTTPQITFTLTDNVDGTLDYTIYVDGSANGQTGTAANNTATDLNLSALSEGTRSIVVQSTDDAGNAVNSTALSITVDATNPTSVINTASGNVSDTTPQITFTLTDNVDGTLDYTIYVDGSANGQTGTAANNTATDLNLSALSEGTHSIIVQAADDAGNDVNSTAIVLTVDTTNPTSSIGAPASGTNTTDTTPQITFTLTDNIDSTLDYTIYVDGSANGQTGTAANNTATDLNLSALSEGTRSIVVQATDNAGNAVNSTALSITVDATNPVSVISAPVNNTNTTDTTPQITFTLTDNTDSTMDYVVYVDGSANGQTGTAANNTATDLNLSALAQGTHTIEVEATDSTGNAANSTALTIVVDTANPTSSISAPAQNSFISDTTPQITFTLTDNIDSTLDYTIYVDGSANGQTGTAANSTATDLNISALTEGNHTITVQATDNAGNDINSTALNVTIDVSNPIVTLISPANGSSFVGLSRGYSWNVTDNQDTSLLCDVIIDGTTEDANVTSANASTITRAITLTTYGAHTWNVTCTDNALNSATSLTFSFQNTPPNGGSGGGGGGGGGGSSSSQTTNDPGPTITPPATTTSACAPTQTYCAGTCCNSNEVCSNGGCRSTTSTETQQESTPAQSTPQSTTSSQGTQSSGITGYAPAETSQAQKDSTKGSSKSTTKVLAFILMMAGLGLAVSFVYRRFGKV